MFHDPERRDEFIKASAKGGRGKNAVIQAEVVEVMRDLPPISDPLSISEFLGDLTRRVLAGEIHPSIANSAAYLAAQRINALKTASQIQKQGSKKSPVHLQKADDDEKQQLEWYHDVEEGNSDGEEDTPEAASGTD